MLSNFCKTKDRFIQVPAVTAFLYATYSEEGEWPLFLVFIGLFICYTGNNVN